MLRALIARRLTVHLLLTCFLAGMLFSLATKGYHANENNQGQLARDIAVIQVYCGIWIFILTLCSLTAYLNINDSIRHSKLYCMLSFFLCPFLMSLVTAHNLDIENALGGPDFIMATLSFMLMHFFFYVIFVRTNFKRPGLQNGSR